MTQARTLVVIGNFDGVHRGHQAVLQAVARMARERSLLPRLLTFEPHPAVTLGRTPPALLTTLDRKRELAARSCPGIELSVRAFTPAFASLTPEQFARQVLVEELSAGLVMVGKNFRFGKGRSGDIGDLQQLGDKLGFATMAEPLVSDAEGAWSSTRIRAFIAAGEVTAAQALLGRPHMLSGTVIRGDQRGRTLGFPTCNIADIPEAMPPFGVYAVLVDRVQDGRAQALGRGVANLGVRPSIQQAEPRPLLEVHLFDLAEELYGAALRVHLVKRLRAERRFDGLDALKAQIAKDSEDARAAVAACAIDEASGAFG